MFGNCDWCGKVENLIPHNGLWLCDHCDSEADTEEQYEQDLMDEHEATEQREEMKAG